VISYQLMPSSLLRYLLQLLPCFTLVSNRHTLIVCLFPAPFPQLSFLIPSPIPFFLLDSFCPLRISLSLSSLSRFLFFFVPFHLHSILAPPPIPVLSCPILFSFLSDSFFRFISYHFCPPVFLIPMSFFIYFFSYSFFFFLILQTPLFSFFFSKSSCTFHTFPYLLVPTFPLFPFCIFLILFLLTYSIFYSFPFPILFLPFISLFFLVAALYPSLSNPFFSYFFLFFILALSYITFFLIPLYTSLPYCLYFSFLVFLLKGLGHGIEYNFLTKIISSYFLLLTNTPTVFFYF